jgi:very-short-patch-repair endonuclease
MWSVARCRPIRQPSSAVSANRSPERASRLVRGVYYNAVHGTHCRISSLTAHEKAHIAARYAAGETIRNLRTEYHRTRQTIKDIILDAGCEIRPPGYGKGRVWTPEWRAAHYAATQTPEFAEKSRQALLQRLPRMRGPAVNTAIERRLHDALRAAGIGFSTQSLLLERYLVDIELRQARIVIEADGAQHMLRDKKLADAERDAALTAAGYRVFRFTGSEINTDAARCIRRVIDEAA